VSLDWVARQIEAINVTSARPPLMRFNPRPPGVIQPGSTSEAVLQILGSSPGRFFTAQQLIQETGRTHAAVSFALLYLRDQGRIEAYPDAARNPRFLRYRIKRE
jgi:hypothetical protein